MSYCLNLECPAPADQKTPDPLKAKFCSNCGMALLLNDRYRALQAIGQGGFGRTFLAVDELKPSKPRCVIKQFFRQQAIEPPEKAAELFRLEAVRLDELGQHPQIPTLFAYFDQNQQKYLVQEFIDGQNLNQQLQDTGAFDEAQIRQLLTDLLPVLQYIHEHQVIHRDIKPDNIIRRQSDRRFVLVDFGASKLAAGDDLLKPGTKIGSQGYIAPEQAEGKATFTSDLYSLGATCIHLLTELPPTVLISEQQSQWKHYLKQPISKTLERLLDRLLESDIQNRYPSAEDVLRDLETATKLEETKRSPQWDIASVKTSPSSFTALPVSSASMHSKQSWICADTIKGHDSWVRSLIYSPNGRVLISGSGDKTVKLWLAETGEPLRVVEGHSSWIRAIAISPDGKTLATTANHKAVWLWDFSTGKLQDTLLGHTDWVRAVTFSPDGQTLITGSQDKTVILWDLATSAPLQTLVGHNHWVVAIALSPDQQILATSGRDQIIKLWHLQTGKCRYSLSGHTAEVLALAINPDGRMLASSSADGTVRLWALNTGKHLHTITGHNSAVNSVAFSPDGKILATSSNDQTVKLWRTTNGKLLETLEGHDGWVWSVTFSPDGQAIASGDWGGTIKIWRSSTQ